MIQRTCSEIVQCTRCNNDIAKSELRRKDRGLHYHATCPDEVSKESLANKQMIRMFQYRK